jgi:AraC family transcriptional regulator, regulatory protein of adaptative response / methylphosphotriester-DNA alkyltransferase methyltransferase
MARRYGEEDLSLASLAHEIATSRRQLQRAFAEAGGTSFSRELQRIRMARAAQLLLDGSLAVQDVAAAVGYRQAAQFAKVFRRHHGVAPSSFRRGRATRRLGKRLYSQPPPLGKRPAWPGAQPCPCLD